MLQKIFVFTCLQLLWTISVPSFSQSVSDANPDVVVSPVFEIQKGGTITLTDISEDWAASLRNISVIHAPQPSGFRAEIAARKAEVNRLAAESATAPAMKTAVVPLPIQGNNFEGQKPNGYPNDNDLAISNSGKIVSVTNSIMHVYDENGGPAQATVSLSALGDAGGAGSFTKFDPKVIYDPNHDRFILVFLSGIRSTSSQLIVCFSNSSDPTQGWNVYVFPGNTYPGNWSDFPQIGISTDELFITANQYTDNLNYTGSTIWQIGLAEGYAGGTLSSRTLLNNFFSLHPVTGGDTMYGPNFYFIRVSTSVPNRTVSIHQITNTIANGGVLNNSLNLQSDRVYDVPPDANQPGTPTALLTNDHRIQSAYLANSRIQWVGNTNFNNRPCIYFGTVTFSPFDLIFSDVKGTIIQNASVELSYPGVTYAGYLGSKSNASLIGVCYSSNGEFAGNGAILVDGEGEYSDILRTRQGRGYLGVGTENSRRWGDYVGLAPRFNNPGEAWLGASFGNITGGTDTWISQIFPNPSVSITPPVTQPTASFTAFPVPAIDLMEIQIEVVQDGEYSLVILDQTGKEIKTLLHNYLRPGTASATFNTHPLASGIYFVVLKDSEGRQVFHQKISVNH